MRRRRKWGIIGSVLVALVLSVAVTCGGCASQHPAEARLAGPLADPSVATLNIRRDDQTQAEILSFDGSALDSLVGHHPPAGTVRVPLRPGTHELRVVVPGPCTYYDGRPGPGPSVSNLRFVARAGIQYEVTLVSVPTQLFDETSVHVYEVVRPNREFRAVEQVVSYEPAPSPCAARRGADATPSVASAERVPSGAPARTETGAPTQDVAAVAGSGSADPPHGAPIERPSGGAGPQPRRPKPGTLRGQ